MNRRSSIRFESSAKCSMVKWPFWSRYSRPRSMTKRIVAHGKLQQNLARHDEMVVPEGDFLRLERLLVRPHQVHPAGDRLAGVLVDHGQLQLPGRSGGRLASRARRPQGGNDMAKRIGSGEQNGAVMQ